MAHQYLMSASHEEVVKLYSELDSLVTQKRLITKIDSVFSAEEIRAAVRRAGQPGLNGKVMVQLS